LSIGGDEVVRRRVGVGSEQYNERGTDGRRKGQKEVGKGRRIAGGKGSEEGVGGKGEKMDKAKEGREWGK